MTTTDRQRIRERAAKALAQVEREADALLPDREPRLIVVDPTAKREKLKIDVNSPTVLATLYSLLSDRNARPRSTGLQM